MFNSLPQTLKEKIRSEYRLRLLAVILASIIALQVSLLVFIFPSWILSINKERDIINRAEKMDKAALDSQIAEVNSAVQLINNKIFIINSALSYPEITRFIDGLLEIKGNGIYIDEISYETSGANIGKISLLGNAVTREALVSFVKRIEESKVYKKVDVPISNFTKDKDLNFSITLTIEG